MPVVNLMSIDVDAIFQELRATTGLFRIWTESGDDIVTQCPFHGGGNERKPSFGLCNNRSNPNYGKYNCFACGAHGTIIGLVNRLANKEADDEYGISVAQSLGDIQLIDERQQIQLLSRTPPKSQKGVSVYELNYYRQERHNYLTNRRVDPVIQDAFDCGYDPTCDSVTFPVRRQDGMTSFIARRCVHTKWYNYPSGVEKPLYGLYELFQLVPNCKSVVVVESIINALTLWGLQIPAIALLGTGSQKQIEFMNQLDVRQWILALDGDSAGVNGTNKLKRKLRASSFVMPIPPGYDVNDLDSHTLNILYSLRR